jgi:hypothetical protein
MHAVADMRDASDAMMQRAMAQVALHDTAGRLWRAEAAACGAALAAQRRGPSKRLRTAADEELVAAHRQHAALAEQRASHDMVLATVMALLDPARFDVDSKDAELALLAAPIHPTRLVVRDAARLTRFARSTRNITLFGVDCAPPFVARTLAMLPRLTGLTLGLGCINPNALLLPFLRRLERVCIAGALHEEFDAADVVSFCAALNHDGRLRYLQLAYRFTEDRDVAAAIDAISELVRCSPRLRDIELEEYHSASGIARPDYTKVAQAVGEHSGLRRIGLNDHHLSAAQIHAMLKPHRSLRDVDFPHLARDAAHFLAATPYLRNLHISDCGDSNEDELVALLHAVRSLEHLTGLMVAIRTAREGHALRDALAGKNLRWLSLTTLDSTPEAFSIIAYAPDGTSTFGPMMRTLKTLQLETMGGFDAAALAMVLRMLPYTDVVCTS